MSSSDDRLIDEIYEAAIVPDFWPSVLERVAACSQSRAGGLILVDPTARPRGVATDVYRPIYAQFDHVADARYRNLRAERAAARRHAGFLRDIDLCTEEELRDDPIYRNLLRPHGLGWTVGTLIVVPTDDVMIFDFARGTEEGPHDAETVVTLDLYRPHLARAALLASRLGLERAHNMTEAMTILGLPAAVLAPRGRPVATNAAFEALRRRVEPVLWGKRYGDPLFRGEDPDGPAEAVLRSIPVPPTGDEPGLVLHVMPIRRAARDVFSGASSIVIATPVAAHTPPSTELIGALFDLTPAEARAARALADGADIADCARRFGLSAGTVRTQVKSAMAKTGTHRQVDFVRLMLGAAGLPRVEREG